MPRQSYSAEQEKLMWRWLYSRAKEGWEEASRPLGIVIWRRLATTYQTKSALSMTTQWPKVEDAPLRLDSMLLICNDCNKDLGEEQLEKLFVRFGKTVTMQDGKYQVVEESDD